MATPAHDGLQPIQTLIDQSGGVTYIGEAKSGEATSANTWRIQKITVSGTVTTMAWAGGDTDYTNIWDNRSSYTYS